MTICDPIFVIVFPVCGVMLVTAVVDSLFHKRTAVQLP